MLEQQQLLKFMETKIAIHEFFIWLLLLNKICYQYGDHHDEKKEKEGGGASSSMVISSNLIPPFALLLS